jgi:hypothetical protein
MLAVCVCCKIEAGNGLGATAEGAAGIVEGAASVARAVGAADGAASGAKAMWVAEDAAEVAVGIIW